ncbi:MAG TPA: prepilin-type N-terminal cleavage/methylation domain-containing protein [Candidatus Ratteibacteria bacterium]|nr:prepilin-type N-terminal cleavage/methylation domain-containing protein [bacterium]HRR95878.1 prepilin-type N-terminal cleavage/methylation domain-containing protein [Candidatus Ratteibacteria bacterium]
MKKKGITLIELIVVIVIGAIGLLAVSFFAMQSWKEWNENEQIKTLQEEMDLVSYTIKGVLEEASNIEILDNGPLSGTKINASYKNEWQKEFYPSGNELIVEDIKNETTRTVTNYLKSISFQQDNTSSDTVLVNLKVGKGGKELENSFIIFLRNKS